MATAIEGEQTHRSGVDPSAAVWQTYYDEASKNRRARRKHRRKRDNKKLRRRLELAFMVGSVFLLAGLFALFHTVLSQ